MGPQAAVWSFQASTPAERPQNVKLWVMDHVLTYHYRKMACISVPSTDSG